VPDQPSLSQARTELERASLSYYLTASDPEATPADISRTVDRLEAAGNAVAEARALDDAWGGRGPSASYAEWVAEGQAEAGT
jgi:hypothetical protein